MTFFWETFFGQLLAFVTFFAFPAIQYLILNRFSHKTGITELWYLPAFGFRLVIRNIPGKYTLSEIKNKTFLRQKIEANSGSSVATLLDTVLLEKDDFFLFPNYDQIILSFRIEGQSKDELKFIQTDKIGNVLQEFSLNSFDSIITDYSATVENFLNFDVKLLRRVEISTEALISCWQNSKEYNVEKRIDHAIKMTNVS